MDFRIADTFTDSLARLTGEEQKAVKTTAFDLQLNPINPGMSFHKLDKAKDKKFWSVRVSSDIRLIVHRSEAMRRTVDEKLQDTLEKRISSSFKQVNDQLEKVFRSVGEMQALAADVGDLSRVLTNVKARGTWAEVLLDNMLEQVMAPEQFERNVEVKPCSGERVDFAVKLPGQGEEGTIWLPIDSKFPTEDYDALVEASDRGDAAAVELALKKLETRVRNEGASISEKYVCAPHTTDFAILYLPTEGLYAEVIRRPGLLDDLQRECRIIVAGPTVLLAMRPDRAIPRS
jgi:DNA recombination protein RmuC